MNNNKYKDYTSLQELQCEKRELLVQIKKESENIKHYSNQLFQPFYSNSPEKPITIVGKVSNTIKTVKHAYSIGKGLVSLFRRFF